jgi:hypothetical protein
MKDLDFEDDYGSWVSGFVFPAISEMNQFRDGSESGYLEISIDNFNEEPITKLQLAAIEHSRAA